MDSRRDMMTGHDSENESDKVVRRFVGGGGHSRKKMCRFCSDAEFVLDYKDGKLLQLFLSEHGKIVPRNCAYHQRKLTISIKRARNLALINPIGLNL